MKGFRYTVVLGALAFLVLFLLYPLSLVLDASLRVKGTGAFTLANYAQIFASKYYLNSIANSVLAAVFATVGATLIGTPLAFCLARVDIPGKTVLLVLATLPLVLPSFVAAYALVLLFGHAGIVTTGFRAIDISIEEAARNLGGSRLHAFRTVLLPVAIPAVLAGALLVFIEALENFGVPVVLAEDRPFLAVDIFKLFAGEADNNPAAAGALSVLLIAGTAVALVIQRRYLSRRSFATNARAAPPPLPLSPGWRTLASVFSWGIVTLSLLPFVAVLFVSFLHFRGPVLTWQLASSNYSMLLEGSFRPLYNTLLLATITAVVATAV